MIFVCCGDVHTLNPIKSEVIEYSKCKVTPLQLVLSIYALMKGNFSKKHTFFYYTDTPFVPVDKRKYN